MPFVLGKPELVEKNLEVVDLSKSWSGGQKNQILQYCRAKKNVDGKENLRIMESRSKTAVNENRYC